MGSEGRRLLKRGKVFKAPGHPASNLEKCINTGEGRRVQRDPESFHVKFRVEGVTVGCGGSAAFELLFIKNSFPAIHWVPPDNRERQPLTGLQAGKEGGLSFC